MCAGERVGRTDSLEKKGKTDEEAWTGKCAFGEK